MDKRPVAHPTGDSPAAQWLSNTDEEFLADVPITHPDPAFPELLQNAKAALQAAHSDAASAPKS